jgi:hypothetical protein
VRRFDGSVTFALCAARLRSLRAVSSLGGGRWAMINGPGSDIVDWQVIRRVKTRQRRGLVK